MGVRRGHGGYAGICIWAVTQNRVCEEVKGIYLSSDDTAHMPNNTENFCVGPFYRWESKVKIWFVVSLVLCQNTLGFWESMRCEILFLRFAFLQYLDVS